MEEEDDDFYAPHEPTDVEIAAAPIAAPLTADGKPADGKPAASKTDGAATQMDEDLEEGEEEEENEDAGDSDSDIDIITERKDGSKPEPPAQPSRYNTIRNIPARTASSEAGTKPSPQVKAETSAKPSPSKSGADYPEVRTSKIDVDAKPVYEPAGKPITAVNIDEDLKEHDKPWRLPGTDVSDYFNYGFDEFTWSLYCLKQEKTRAEVQDDKKGFSMIMEGGPMGMPGLPSVSAGPQAGLTMPPMPGMGEMGPEMMTQMAQMAQMMGPGMDMSQMDPSMFGMQAPPTGPSGGNQGQAFGGGQQGYGAQGPNQQQMGYGFDPSIMGGDAGRNRQGNQGNFGGRGRGGNRRNW